MLNFARGQGGQAGLQRAPVGHTAERNV